MWLHAPPAAPRGTWAAATRVSACAGPCSAASRAHLTQDVTWLASRQRKPEVAAAAAAAATSQISAFGAAGRAAAAGFATKSVSQPSRPPKEGDEEAPVEETGGAGGGQVTVGGGDGEGAAAAAPGAASDAHHSFISAARSRCVASEGPPQAAILAPRHRTRLREPRQLQRLRRYRSAFVRPDARPAALDHVRNAARAARRPKRRAASAPARDERACRIKKRQAPEPQPRRRSRASSRLHRCAGAQAVREATRARERRLNCRSLPYMRRSS